MSKPNPFIKQDGLQAFSVEGSGPSVNSFTGVLGPQGMCSCGSLTSWSSLQLQQQQLLGNDHSTCCSTSNNAQQDMFVVVLTNSDRAAGGAATAADAAAAGKAGPVKPKPHSSQHGIGTDSKDTNSGCAAGQVRHTAARVTGAAEACLRMWA
jgi:hypothetical protein